MNRSGLESKGIELGEKLIEGKTKILYLVKGNPPYVVVESKPLLSKGDGAVIDLVPGKDEWANRTTCNMFKILKRMNIPVSYVEKIDDTRFLALRGDMISYEVVIRGIATGSYCKRHPEITEGTVLPTPVVELFLKTTGRKYEGHDLEVDDPYVEFSKGKALLYHPKKPMKDQIVPGKPVVKGQKPFLELNDYPLKDTPQTIDEIIALARETFIVLRDSWAKLDATLFDMKIEVQLDNNGEPRLSDVVDLDSWRLEKDGKHIDKEPYRKNAPLDEVAEIYRNGADLSDQLVAMA